jgi:hypothetical protein
MTNNSVFVLQSQYLLLITSYHLTGFI